jgi:hypothetical protein
MVSLTDLFLVGLALDITGACLLANGLLLSASTISNITATLWGSNLEATHDRCSNRVDAEFGVGYLALGFLLQAAGYSLEISGVQAATGTDRLVAALAMAVIAVAVATGIYARFHGGRVERLIAETKAEDDRRKAEAAMRKGAEKAEVAS